VESSLVRWRHVPSLGQLAFSLLGNMLTGQLIEAWLLPCKVYADAYGTERLAVEDHDSR
jgi:hypothetical protein